MSTPVRETYTTATSHDHMTHHCDCSNDSTCLLQSLTTPAQCSPKQFKLLTAQTCMSLEVAHRLHTKHKNMSVFEGPMMFRRTRHYLLTNNTI